MVRLPLLLVLIGMVILPIVLAEEDGNSTDGYTVREYALISFDDPMTPEDQVNNTTAMPVASEKADNQTRRGGELSARKLFQLKQGAQGDYRVLRNLSGDPSLGLSSTAAQGISILCKQCVPQKSGYY